MDLNNEIKKHMRMQSLIGFIGFPFILALIFGGMSFLNGDAIFPFLEVDSNSLYVFVIGIIGTVLELWFGTKNALKIRALKNKVT
ncbi:hypothetical protein [Thalassotalea crassostreae]|uniref:hypothetical protein n=1 Tax=Thalassotalea crassostreae TaxID=1763536 RepID=UPI0008382FF1|nr:hypothetical protein [Thalassotalea crassostreae]